MADIAENTPITDAATAVALGKRHLLVRDYNSAVNTLIQACELLVKKHGEGADELAEPYLLYGRALLGLAREESNVLGAGVPGTKDSDDEVDGEDDEEVDGDEKDDVAEKEAAASPKKDETDNSTQSKEENKTDEKKSEELKQESEKKSDESVLKAKDTKPEETIPVDSAEDKSEETNVTDDKKAEEKSKEDKKDEISNDEATPGSSKMTNGESSTTVQNGEVKQNGEDVEDVNEDEDVDNLEVAWEVLELAKLVLLKRGPPGWKYLAEAHKLLGEVAMEGGNANGAVTDFEASLNLLQKIEPCNPRAIAEIYYQLGLAYSFMNDFDSSVEQFKEASSLLQATIKELEQTTEPPVSDDPFYSVAGEIKELMELLPEIEEKISDMKDAKQEACKLIIEGIREKAAIGSCSNGAGTSAVNGNSSESVSGSSSKPASDISHLIRKKRKTEETPADASPCKKLSPQ